MPLPRILLLFTLLVIGSAPALALDAHQAIERKPASAAEANRLCLTCHREADHQVRASIHWTWQRERKVNGRRQTLALQDDLSRYGIGAGANTEICGRCHIRIEEKGKPDTADCLLCHDTTGRYGPGLPVRELQDIVRRAGPTSPRTCTRCHGRDCGLRPDQESGSAYMEDVHLRRAGLTCRSCHPAVGHTIARTPADILRPGQGCLACHPAQVHSQPELDRHTRTMTCTSCHVPAYGTATPVVLAWNWLQGDSRTLFTTEGGLAAGQGFILGRRLSPILLWSDGGEQLYTRGERIRPGSTVVLAGPSTRSEHSRLAPFSVQYGTQMVDAKYRYLISPLLTMTRAPFLSRTDMDRALREGMTGIRLPFSGQTRVVSTVQYRSLHHGTAPADQALGCLDCHGTAGRIDWTGLGFSGDPWLPQAIMTRPDPPDRLPEPPFSSSPIRQKVLPVAPSL